MAGITNVLLLVLNKKLCLKSQVTMTKVMF